MEKETFYEKLQKLEPTVKAYFDVKKITEASESMYIRDKCGTFHPHFDKSGERDEKSLASTLKIIRIIMAVAAIWGIVCVIIGIANSSGMDIALGIAIGVGVFFLYRYLNGKFKEKLCAAQERADAENAYQGQIEKAKAEHRTAVATIQARYEELKKKFEEENLASILLYVHSYNDFYEMLSYAQEHPKQTTPGPCLKVMAEREKKNKESEAYYSSMYASIMRDSSFESDNAEVLQDDSEAREREEIWQQHLQQQERLEAECKERAEERNRQEKERIERMRLEKAAFRKCSTCVNSTKCPSSVRIQSLTCSAFKLK